MRGRVTLWIAGASAAVACTFLGCVDLFHSTDFLTLCQVDAGVCAPAADAASPPVPDAAMPPTDFCLWDAATAQSNAIRACTLLAACETPLGDNATGSCLANAILAYDCVANPNRKVKGAAHDFWDRLAHAATCGDVDRLVFQGSVPTCTIRDGFTGFTACQGERTRVECDTSGSRVYAESCGASARVCSSAGNAGTCTGTGGFACLTSGCEATQLHLCGHGGIDDGFDCASFGAQRCKDTAVGPSCEAESRVSCAPSGDVQCQGATIAVGCPSGFEERVDCAALVAGRGVCSVRVGGKTFDVSRACAKSPAAECTIDTCSGPQLAACVRGYAVAVDCAAWGLGPCQKFSTLDGDRFACSPR